MNLSLGSEAHTPNDNLTMFNQPNFDIQKYNALNIFEKTIESYSIGNNILKPFSILLIKYSWITYAEINHWHNSSFITYNNKIQCQF